jgi:hypothetical protein
LVEKGNSIDVDKPILSYVYHKDDYFNFVEEQRISSHETEMVAEAAEVYNEIHRTPDTTVLLREIRHLIHQGSISDKGFDSCWILDILYVIVLLTFFLLFNG